jgi:hypothetical protein
MKKLIAISVVFALVAGAAFAVDVSGTVFGKANVLESTTGKDDTVRATGEMPRVRLDGGGEAGDGEFGGYVRFQAGDVVSGVQYEKDYSTTPPTETSKLDVGKANVLVVDSAYAWWKPLDQFKLIIGANSDGFWGKEGVTGWSFNQMPYDAHVATNPGIWYGNYWASGPFSKGNQESYAGGPFMDNRYVFFEGWLDWGAGMEITPTDMVGINIAIPFQAGSGHPAKAGSKDHADDAKYIYQAAIFQMDLKLDFGNIAITYDGGGRAVYGNPVESTGAIYAYAGLNVIENLGIDVGLSFHMKGNEDYGQNKESLPIGFGVGLKYTADAFGVKFRTTAALGGNEKGNAQDLIYINTSVLPYFTINDNMAAFVNVGLGVLMGDSDKVKAKTGNDTNIGWYFNPYLRVGAEWGPSFYAGIQAASDGTKAYPDKTMVEWSVPIALIVSF